MQEYKSLDQLAWERQNWAVCQMIEKLNSAKRIEVMKAIFVRASHGLDEIRSIEALEFFRAALYDSVLIPLLVRNGEGARSLPVNADTMTAKGIAQSALTKALMQLYAKLPLRSQAAKPTLLESKRWMLQEIGKSWRETEDEELTNEICLFFANIEVPQKFNEEKKMILDVVRNVLQEGFSVSRIMSQIILIPTPMRTSRLDLEIKQILAVARVRNKMRGNLPSSSLEIDREMRILQQMDGCSTGAFDYIAGISKEIRAFDVQTRELAAMIIKANSSFWASSVLVTYLNPRHIIIDENVFVSESRYQESVMNERFKCSKSKILAWKKDNDCAVVLNVNIKEHQTKNASTVMHKTETF
ncbi:MAG: hypothetical protein WAX81_02375 [Candidatus Moraniibacteriota bacterium]